MSERWGSFALVISLGLVNQACTGDFSQITRSLASVSGRGGLRGSSLQEIGAEAYAIHAANGLIHSHDLGYGYSYGPSIIRVDGTYHAYFCSSGTGENDWDHVRHSTSTDLLHWSEPNTLITSTLRERANCDPSVVQFDAGDGPFYYMMFSGNVRDVQTANFLARSISPNGPFLKLTDRGTWEDQPVDSRVIVGPVIATPDNSGIYGAGQASMVVRNGEVWQFYNDTTSDGPGNNNRAFLMRSRDMVNWSAPLATDALAGSFDVKFDPERNAFVMFDIDQDHSRTAHLTMRISQDGLHWTEPVVLCETGCFPNYANNVGVSGDAGGNLIPGTDFLIAYGAPYGLNSAYTNDCQQTPDNCFGNWDLAGQIVSRRAQLGILQTAGGIYFYNGNDALCRVATMDDLTQIGIQNLQFLGVLPSSARNDGDCAIAQREGFFSNVNGIFYSNGVDAYCHVSDPDDMGNFIRMRGTADITARSSFPNMRNDGECHMPQPEGFFSNGAEGIFYSNGADAFCHVSNPDDMIVFIRARGSDRVAARSTFPNMRRDGECQVAAAEGFFSNAEGIFYSNGVDAFCHVGNMEDFGEMARRRGSADVTARSSFPHMRRDGTCPVSRSSAR